MTSFNNMFALISVVIGIYSLYAAFTGKGAAYKNDYPASIKAGADKLLRTFLWMFGPILLAQGACDYFGYTTISLILIGVVVGLIAAYLIVFYKRYGKALRGK